MEETHLPAAQRAYDHTKTLILDGSAKPNDMLSEGEVATQLGVSRTPVREAFTRLQSEGWLRLYPRRGALVVPPDHEQARDLVTARIMLESAALEAATGRKPGEEEPDLVQLSTALYWSSAFRKANHAPSVNPGLVLRDPCAEALEDREPWPCVGVSAQPIHLRS
jgi:DNA-binding GntR family transcriptional regulator